MKKKGSNNKIKLNIKGCFSDRENIRPYHLNVQLEDFDSDTRVRIANKTYELCELYNNSNRQAWTNYDYIQPFCQDILTNIYNQIVRSNGIYDFYEIIAGLQKMIVKLDIFDVLDLVEYIVKRISQDFETLLSPATKAFNELFEHDNVGYRFVNDKIVAITSKTEIEEIEHSANTTYSGVNGHIRRAVELLADTKSKDYKNSVKESISAVEAICKIITKKDNATLGDAIKLLEKKGLKGVLKTAFEKLYSYTNNAGGIRHSDGLFVNDVKFHEAKYMLVTCSAFVNYLVDEFKDELK